MENDRRNAGCFKMPEGDVVTGMSYGFTFSILFWLLIAWMCTCGTGCANWQGAEFKIGIGTYNGAHETKTYTPDTDHSKK